MVNISVDITILAVLLSVAFILRRNFDASESFFFSFIIIIGDFVLVLISLLARDDEMLLAGFLTTTNYDQQQLQVTFYFGFVKHTKH